MDGMGWDGMGHCKTYVDWVALSVIQGGTVLELFSSFRVSFSKRIKAADQVIEGRIRLTEKNR